MKILIGPLEPDKITELSKSNISCFNHQELAFIYKDPDYLKKNYNFDILIWYLPEKNHIPEKISLLDSLLYSYTENTESESFYLDCVFKSFDEIYIKSEDDGIFNANFQKSIKFIANLDELLNSLLLNDISLNSQKRMILNLSDIEKKLLYGIYSLKRRDLSNSGNYFSKALSLAGNESFQAYYLNALFLAISSENMVQEEHKSIFLSKALDLLDKALDIIPDNLQALYFKANIYLYQKKKFPAADIFQKIINLSIKEFSLITDSELLFCSFPSASLFFKKVNLYYFRDEPISLKERLKNLIIEEAKSQLNKIYPQSHINSAKDIIYKPRVILSTFFSPFGISEYFERALRKKVDLLTCGPYLSEEDINTWKSYEKEHLFKPPAEVQNAKYDYLLKISKAPDIIMPRGQASVPEILEHLPAGWEPDLFIWIDCYSQFLPYNPVNYLKCPSLCIVIDTHTGQLEWRREYARSYTHTMVYHHDYIKYFLQDGLKNLEWLPPACDSEIHAYTDSEKIYDLAFIGQTNPRWHSERVKLIEILKENSFDIYIDTLYGKEMAKAYSSSKVAFNKSINHDINMRVFEALCAGTMLITDNLPEETRFHELFDIGKDLIVYDNSEQLLNLVRYYLNNPLEREEIAMNGRKKVLDKHTYDHRVEKILKFCL